MAKATKKRRRSGGRDAVGVAASGAARPRRKEKKARLRVRVSRRKRRSRLKVGLLRRKERGPHGNGSLKVSATTVARAKITRLRERAEVEETTADLRTTGASQGLTRVKDRPRVRMAAVIDGEAIVAESVGTAVERTEAVVGIRRVNNQGNSSSQLLRKRKRRQKIIEDSVTFRDV